ncbi:uncharacterized protein [Leptinotarsa decemlineata]|uniref:uncharacterized protein n=1 Tax=Leptinotarsa decemlineata TaxID=7539 RepID=UPI003D30B79B
MSTKTKRPLRSLSAHEKLDAIGRVHNGESKASVARDIGVPESTLRGWCKNESKISYLSRQSSPETDESLEQSNAKKIKIEEPEMQPFDLSLKINGTSYSHDSPLDYTKSDSPNRSLNVTDKIDTPKTAIPERDRNRVELARLSAELGLNRPESLPATTSSANVADLVMVAQWNAALMRKQQSQLSVATSTTPQDAVGVASTSGGLLAIAEEENRQLPREQQSVNETVLNWIKSQQALMHPPQTHLVPNGFSTPLPNTSSPGAKGPSFSHSSLILQWYEQMFNHQLQLSGQDDRTILYQQLTRNTPVPVRHVSPTYPVDQNGENSSANNVSSGFGHRAGNNKTRTVLDNLLNNNNITVKEEPHEEDTITREEAMDYGEKFVRWLETCSHPSVTAMHIMQIRGLLSNLKGAGSRQNCELQNKTKVRRK